MYVSCFYGTYSMVRTVWYVQYGTYSMVCMVRTVWYVQYGTYSMVRTVWYVQYGTYSMVRTVWYVWYVQYSTCQKIVPLALHGISVVLKQHKTVRSILFFAESLRCHVYPKHDHFPMWMYMASVCVCVRVRVRARAHVCVEINMTLLLRRVPDILGQFYTVISCSLTGVPTCGQLPLQLYYDYDYY